MHPILQHLEELRAESARRYRALDDVVGELTRRADEAAGAPFAHLRQLPDLMMEARRRLGPSQIETERQRLLEDLCRVYPTLEPRQRGEVRRYFKDATRRDLLVALGGCITTATRNLRTADDAPWLTLGLAAASIDDATIDFRDLSLSLEELKDAAIRAGIDPAPSFRQAAEISSAKRTGTCPGSLRSLLRGWADALESGRQEGTEE